MKNKSKPDIKYFKSRALRRVMHGRIDSISDPNTSKDYHDRSSMISIVKGKNELRVLTKEEFLEARVMRISWFGGGGLGLSVHETLPAGVVGKEVKYVEEQVNVGNYNITQQEFSVNGVIIHEGVTVNRYGK